MKIYSQAEINGVVGKNREYRKFWNEKAKLICKTKSHLSRQMICKEINECWQECQAVIHEENFEQPIATKVETIPNNVKRLRTVEELIHRAEEKSKNKNELSYLKVELKRAKDAMRKNMKREEQASSSSSKESDRSDMT